MARKRTIYFPADPFQTLFWMKSATMNSSLIYGTNLNNLNRRSRVHQIAVGLLFPVWYLISLKDHSPKAYQVMKLKWSWKEKEVKGETEILVKNQDFLWSHKNSHTVQQRSPLWLKILKSPLEEQQVFYKPFPIAFALHLHIFHNHTSVWWPLMK